VCVYGEVSGERARPGEWRARHSKCTRQASHKTSPFKSLRQLTPFANSLTPCANSLTPCANSRLRFPRLCIELPRESERLSKTSEWGKGREGWRETVMGRVRGRVIDARMSIVQDRFYQHLQLLQQHPIVFSQESLILTHLLRVEIQKNIPSRKQLSH
jgi:hypothetical protein